jgi:hypothetical protein
MLEGHKNWMKKTPYNRMIARRINFKSWQTNGFLCSIGAGLFFIFSPLLFVYIPVVIYGYIDYIVFIKNYQKYMQTIEGTKFFCYNSRTNKQSYIKNNIIPVLPKDVKLIYLNGRTPITEYQPQYISHALKSIKDRKGFPYLLKISGGQLIVKSINNDFYNTINQNKDLGHLVKKIDSFYVTT